MERISGTFYAYTPNNQLDYEKDLIRSVPGADVLVDYTYRADGLLQSKTDIAGMRTSYGYDTYLRNTTITTSADGAGNYPAKTQTFTYNLGDLTATSQDCSCSPAATSFFYETTGRVDWVTPWLDGFVWHEHLQPAAETQGETNEVCGVSVSESGWLQPARAYRLPTRRWASAA